MKQGKLLSIIALVISAIPSVLYICTKIESAVHHITMDYTHLPFNDTLIICIFLIPIIFLVGVILSVIALTKKQKSGWISLGLSLINLLQFCLVIRSLNS